MNVNFSVIESGASFKIVLTFAFMDAKLILRLTNKLL